jgi:hypothetical protein
MLATGDIADDGAGGVGTSVPEGTMGGVANFVRGTNLAPGGLPVSSFRIAAIATGDIADDGAGGLVLKALYVWN